MHIFFAIIIFLIVTLGPVIIAIFFAIIILIGFIIYLLTKILHYVYKFLKEYIKADKTKKSEIIANVKFNFKNIKSLLYNTLEKTGLLLVKYVKFIEKYMQIIDKIIKRLKNE